MALSLIVAMSENRAIGRNGGLPWRLSADLRRFKRVTMGHHIIMGRLTYNSIGGPLPGRTSVVISRIENYDLPTVKVARSFREAIELTAADGEPFVTGGSQIFALALPFVHRLYVTQVHAHIEGDVFFPEVSRDAWRLIEREAHTADEKNEYDYSFLTFDRTQVTTANRWGEG